MKLTDRFTDAMTYTISLHQSQSRKNTDVPYITHLLAVTSLVLEEGGDEDLAIAALLHDAVEDQGGMDRLNEIRQLYGDHVAHIVEACSDSFTSPKSPWKIRKDYYLDHLKNADNDVLLVSLADKLHNSSTIYKDLLKEGGIIWDRFNGGKEGTIWYYKQLEEIFIKSNLSPILVSQLVEYVNQIEAYGNNTLSDNTRESVV
jgi:(p)ppGpp synthase/HD superfamily hydrolase